MRRLVLGLVLTAGCSDSELGVVVDGERLAVVDMHLHPGEWDSIPPETQAFLASRFPFPIDLRPDKAAEVLSPEGILEQMDRAGVSVGVLFAIHAPRTVGVFTNDALIADVASNPQRFYGLANPRVDRWNDEQDADCSACARPCSPPGSSASSWPTRTSSSASTTRATSASTRSRRS